MISGIDIGSRGVHNCGLRTADCVEFRVFWTCGLRTPLDGRPKTWEIFPSRDRDTRASLIRMYNQKNFDFIAVFKYTDTIIRKLQ